MKETNLFNPFAALPTEAPPAVPAKADKEGDVVKALGEQHHKMIDWMLIHYTGKNLGEMAEVFGYSRSYLSVLINSDAFKAEMARRREGVNNEHLQRIVGKTMKVAEQSLDELSKILAEDDDELDPRLVVDIMDKSISRLGYSPTRPILGNAAGGEKGDLHLHYHSVDPGTLASAQERIRNRAAAGGREYVQDPEPLALEQSGS